MNMLSSAVLGCAILAFPAVVWWSGRGRRGNLLFSVGNALAFLILTGAWLIVRRASETHPWLLCLSGVMLTALLGWIAFFGIVRPRDAGRLREGRRTRWRAFLLVLVVLLSIPLSRLALLLRGQADIEQRLRSVGRSEFFERR